VNNKNIPGRQSPALILALLFYFPIHAAWGDVIVMKNGDRITGEISQIWDKEITIEPSYADNEFNVDVEAVAYIDSERDFDLDLSDGRSVTGQLMGADSQGNQLILVAGTTTAIPLAQLEELDEPEDYFDWESHVDFNMDLDRGNTDSDDYKLRGDTTLKLGDHRHIGDIQFIRERQDGDTTKKQDLLRYNYNWLFNDPWFLGGAGSYEKDPIKDLDYRYILGATFGRDIFNNPKVFLNFQLGAGYQNEKIGGENEDSAVGLWQLRYKQDIFTSDFEIFHDDSVTTNITGRSATVVKTTSGLRFEVTDLLYLNLSVDYDWESDPAPGTEDYDLSLMVGFGAEFE
jgi:putative salt-induced outer membrane protein YdiY